jgi:beta-lactamase class A
MVRAFTLLLAAPAFAVPMPELQASLERMADAFPGKLGVAVLDLDSGAMATVRGWQPAPMASVFKLPTAIAVLRRAQDEGLPLSTPVHGGFDERAPGWSPLASSIPRTGLDLSLDALVEAMVADSDNTAADVLLRWLGSPAVVSETMVRLGVDGIRVDRSERSLAYVLGGAASPAVPEPLEALNARLQAVPEAQRARALRAFSADRRDQASPEALVQLLAALDAGRLLDEEHTARLLEILRATRTGPRRLRAGLPGNVALAHKTGLWPSMGGFSVAVNDVGIATGAGRRLAIAVLVTDGHASVERCEDLIAQVARTVWSGSSAADQGRPLR